MSYQQAIFANGEFYHIFNRGVERRQIFANKRDYQRFFQTLLFYRQEYNPQFRFSFQKRQFLILNTKPSTSPLVDLVCYVLMPTHFHFLVKQVRDRGITTLLSKLSNSYTKYFNIKYKRVGPLLQGPFQARRVEDDEQLIHLSRYVHLNPIVDSLVKDLGDSPYSSYPEYLGLSETNLFQKKSVLSNFSSAKDYEQFVLDQVQYARELKKIERLLFNE